MYIQKEKIVFS